MYLLRVNMSQVDPTSKETSWNNNLSYKDETGKSIATSRLIVKKNVPSKNKTYLDDSISDLPYLMKTDAQRIQDASVTQDGVRIPLNYDLVKHLVRKKTLIIEPVTYTCAPNMFLEERRSSTDESRALGVSFAQYRSTCKYIYRS